VRSEPSAAQCLKIAPKAANHQPGGVRRCSVCNSAGCDYASVEQVNRDTLNPLLKALTGTAFMRYFKTTLYCDCPLWPDDGMCAMRDCSVCECEDDEVPAPWKLAERGHVKVACQASGAECGPCTEHYVLKPQRTEPSWQFDCIS